MQIDSVVEESLSISLLFDEAAFAKVRVIKS